MRLKDLLDMTGPFADMDIPALWDDSRRVTAGSLFAALPPVCDVTQSGDAFIADAVSAGASAVIVSRISAESWQKKYPGVCFIPADDPRAAFASVVERFYGHPSSKVRVLGVTGTNGKTTITYFLEAILKAAGQESGVVGTINYRVGGRVLPSKNTTPGFLDNQIFLDDLSSQRVEYAVMEVSSHALAQKRVNLIDFRGAIFTNLTGDHLDFHKTMEEYFQAKALLFTGLCGHAFAVINADDPYGRRLLGMTQARVITYSLDVPADVTAQVETFTLAGTRLKIRFYGREVLLQTHFIGRHNLYNILAAFAAGLGEGIDPDIIRQGIESLPWVPGRLERVDAGQDFSVFIDYAHTDDGLRNVLMCLKARMGAVACELADHTIITSDNPRDEDPASIIDEIVPGFARKNYEIVVDREAAIAWALSIAGKDDIVLLAGKGHETYQVLKDRTVDFVERDIVMNILNKA